MLMRLKVAGALFDRPKPLINCFLAEKKRATKNTPFDKGRMLRTSNSLTEEADYILCREQQANCRSSAMASTAYFSVAVQRKLCVIWRLRVIEDANEKRFTER